LLLAAFFLALCCAPIACLRKEYADQLNFAEEIANHGGAITSMPGSHPWLNYFLGKQLNRDVVQVTITKECVTPEIMGRMPLLFALEAFDGKLTISGITESGYEKLCQLLPRTYINSSEYGPGDDLQTRRTGAGQ
jgi:hypothetical protein